MWTRRAAQPAIESCSSYQLSRVGGTKSSPLSAAAVASDSIMGSSFSFMKRSPSARVSHTSKMRKTPAS